MNADAGPTEARLSAIMWGRLCGGASDLVRKTGLRQSPAPPNGFPSYTRAAGVVRALMTFIALAIVPFDG